MRFSKYTPKELYYFYEDYILINPFSILFYSIITLGIYFIVWLYKTNNKLCELDDDSPDPRRGVVILLLLPIFWFTVINIFRYLLFPDNPIIVKNFEILAGLLLFSYLCSIYMSSVYLLER